MSDFRPPALPLLVREVAEFGAMRFLARFGPPVRLDNARGHGAVVVVPGFMADDNTTARLRRSLAAGGQPVYGWAQGRNRLISEQLFDRLDDRVTAIQADCGIAEPIILIGWSMGGLIAREYGKRAADRVSKVITLGSPFSGDVRGNNAWRAFEVITGHRLDDPPVKADLKVKPPMPTVAFWSRRDGIISPASARGEVGESDRQVELKCNHMGFVSQPAAICAVAREVQQG